MALNIIREHSNQSESIRDYNVYEQLGKGGFATVHRAISKDNSAEVAIKMVKNCSQCLFIEMYNTFNSLTRMISSLLIFRQKNVRIDFRFKIPTIPDFTMPPPLSALSSFYFLNTQKIGP